MTFNEYQELAKTTAIYPKDRGIDYVIHGLTSEAGEIAGKWKKVLRDNNGILTEEKRQALIFELSDVFWYCAALSTELNTTMENVAQLNIDKLFSRKDRGVLGGSGDSR